MKKSNILLALSLILIFATGQGCARNDRSSGVVSGLRLISYNVRCLTPADTGEFAWNARKEASINMILTEMPDVICFQEPWRPQVMFFVAQLLQYDCAKIGRESGLREDGGEHIMIMWNVDKYSLVDSGHFWLSETPREVSMGWDAACYRVAQWVRLKERRTGKEFYVFNTHLDHKGAVAREQEAKLIARMMRKIAGKKVPMFLTGDMNVAHGSPEESVLAPFTDWMESVRETAPETDSRATFNGFGSAKGSRIIDYIYYRNAGPLRYQTLDEDIYGTRYISDHYPILGVFEF